MGNYVPYAFENKRYHTWNYHVKNKVGQKIVKVALDGGFDGPNRDGTVAHGGGTFVSAAGSGDFAGNRADPIEVQFQQIKDRMHEQRSEGKYLAYFQAFTNPHAPVEVLK
ncbi:TIGR01212 family radical SAM protein, partial [Staphylococcus sp. SIMBA_130]